MKKVLFYFLALFACAACTTDNDTPVTPEESVQVTFNVSSLDVDVQPMHARTRAAVAAGESSLTEIRYWIYNPNTNEITKGTQTAASAGDDFGKITLTLPKGDNYRFVFWGLNANNPGGTFSYSNATAFSSDFYVTTYNKEVFQYVSEKTNVGTTTKTFDIALSRSVGQLVFDFSDEEVPEELGKIEATFWAYTEDVLQYEYGSTYKYSNWGEHNLTIPFTQSGIEKTGVYLLPTNVMRLTLSIYDTNNKPIGTTNVDGVTTLPNRRTIIRGNLMDVFAGRELSVSVNEDWGTDNVITLQ